MSIDSKIRGEWDLEVMECILLRWFFFGFRGVIGELLIEAGELQGGLATVKGAGLGPFWKLRNPSLHVIFIKTYFSSSPTPLFPSHVKTLLSYKASHPK
jgi:hypothetical protein